MSERSLDKLCTVAAQIEQQAVELQRLGLNDTAHILNMAVLDLNRHVYMSRIVPVASIAAKAKTH
jgi:hypothetical protein